VISGIALVVHGAVAVVAKAKLMDDTTTAMKVAAIVTSTNLLLFQSAYVLRTKKHSEQETDIRLKHEQILFNNWHLPEFSFGMKFMYKCPARRRKGTYRVMIYRPLTLDQDDRSRNVHS
jgi:energy-converting hydrogenase Eha subunit C